MAVCRIHRLVTVDSNKSKQQGFFRITSMEMHQNKKKMMFLFENEIKANKGENYNSAKIIILGQGRNRIKIFLKTSNENLSRT